MKKQILAAVVVAAFALGLAGSLAWASGALSVDIPFSFIVKDKEMPAGRYEIRTEGEANLAIKSAERGGTVLVPILERLADTGGKEPKVIFDKMEDGKTYLSEVHVPGQDGFLVGIAGGKEKHVTVKGKE
ncbi:MAG: hypothetical protein MUO25_02305 [Thermoanaerobaculaceae bacterium]|nr:hypothetical protein [Thermoanaerobaculaceae bacterium]